MIMDDNQSVTPGRVMNEDNEHNVGVAGTIIDNVHTADQMIADISQDDSACRLSAFKINEGVSGRHVAFK